MGSRLAEGPEPDEGRKKRTNRSSLRHPPSVWDAVPGCGPGFHPVELPKAASSRNKNCVSFRFSLLFFQSPVYEQR